MTEGFDKLKNPVVRAAVAALDAGDAATWSRLYADTVALYDDGSPRDFAKFTEEALGHERFTQVDKVEKDGLEVYGRYHSEQWGDFKAFFKFRLGSDGKITHLDIGQARY